MPNNIPDIKKLLESQLGSPVLLRANGGRKKIIERRGVLTETYPSVFIVELDQAQHNFDTMSYSYSDILTSNVQMTFYNDKNEEIFA